MEAKKIEKQLSDHFAKLNPTPSSIMGTAGFFLEKGKENPKNVETCIQKWFSEFRKNQENLSESKLTCQLYLINDVLQKAKFQHVKIFLSEFYATRLSQLV